MIKFSKFTAMTPAGAVGLALPVILPAVTLETGEWLFHPRIRRQSGAWWHEEDDVKE